METRAGARTPNSILRKRQNKENAEHKQAKRSRMLGRRVSFAPDDELETMHLFNKDGKAMGNMSPGTPQEQTLQMGAPANLQDANGAATSSAEQDAARQVNESLLQWGGGDALMMMPDLDSNLSPLSMDLTNNSIDSRLLQQGQEQQLQQHTSNLYLSELQQQHEQGGSGGVEQQEQGGSHASGQPGTNHGSYPLYGGADFTRNITCNVPALSTLVEEDEEAGDLVSEQQQSGSPMQLTGEMNNGASMQGISPSEMSPELGVNMFRAFESVVGHGALHDSSPISPYVSQHLGMRANASPDTPTTGNLRDKWGFNPGADDTLDVSHGHLVMGDRTYNHVYGSSLTGEITRAIGAGQLNPMAGSLVTTRAQLVNATLKLQQPTMTDIEVSPADHQHAYRNTQVAPDHEEKQQQEPSSEPPNNDDLTAPWNQQVAAAAAAAAQPLQLLSPVEMSPGMPSPNPLLTTNLSTYTQPAAPVATSGDWAPVPQQTEPHQLNTSQPSPQYYPPVAAAAPHPPLVSAYEFSPPITTRVAQARMQAPDVTICLLADDLQTRTWQAPLHSLHHTERESSVMPPAPVVQLTSGIPAGTALGTHHRRSAAGDVTALMGGTTQLLQHQNYTTHLLDDTGKAGVGGRGTAGIGGVLPPAQTNHAAQASTSRAAGYVAGAQYRDADFHSGSLLAPAPPLRAADRTVKSSDLADGMLDEYTLDDFALPPTPSAPKFNSGSALHGQQQPQQQMHPMHSPLMPFHRPPSSSNYSSSNNNAGMALLQKAAALPLPQEFSNSGEESGVHASRSRPVTGMALLSQEERRHAEVHPITCQDFLSMLGISFAEKVRRTSFLPKADAPPEGFAATYEAAFVTGARCNEYQSIMQQMSTRLVQVQTGLQATEADMAMSNPRIFQTVQASSSNELDRLKDQMILLRRICRLRATKAHKLTRIEFEEQLSCGLNSNMQQLQQELAFMKAELGSAQQLEQLFKTWQVDEADRTQQQFKKLEEAALHQKVMAAKQQRLVEAEGSNAARASRVETAQRGLQDLQAQCTDMQERKLQLQQRLATLHSSGSAAASAPKEPNTLSADMQARQQDLDILLGLQGLKVDVKGFASTREWFMTLDGTAHVQVSMANLQDNGSCSVAVSLLRKGSSWEDVTHGLFQHAASRCLGSTNRLDVPLIQLTPLLRALQTQLGLASSLAAQIAPLLQAFPLLGNASWNPPHPSASTPDLVTTLRATNLQSAPTTSAPTGSTSLTVQPATPAALLLTFLNPATSTKIVVSIPAAGLHHMCTVPPALGVRVVLPQNASSLESGVSICKVLQDIQASEVYLQHVCTVMSTILLSSSTGTDADGGAWAAGSEVQMAARTPLRAARVYDNPLFG